MTGGRPVRLAGPALLLATAALVAGCAQPLPPTKLAYVGVWRGDDVLLRITRGGHIDYRGDSASRRLSLSLPIRANGDGRILTGFPLWNTELRIDRAPARHGGRWSMVIDGHALYRVDDPSGGGGGGGVEI